MSWISSTRRSLLGASLVLGLAHCKGGETEASKAEVTVAPDNPLVIAVDMEMNGKQLTGPWTGFYLTMANNTSKPITILAITGKVSSTASQNPQDAAWSPDSVVGSATSTCTYASFGTWNVSETKPFGLKNGTAACDIDVISFLLDGLEKPADKNGSYRYRVVLKLFGWFGTFDKPTDRFEKTVTFYTR